MFWGILVGFIVFWLFVRFLGYFINLLGFWGIFVILEVLVIFRVSRVFCSFERFQLYFN